MSVYVDELIVWPNATGIFRAGSCHMAADTLDAYASAKRQIGALDFTGLLVDVDSQGAVYVQVGQ